MVILTIITALTILIACTIGAVVGFGGGVIIKPVLDSMSFCSVETVNFISSCSVLAMSISSIIRHIKQKTSFNKKLALLVSFGAVMGGFFGSRLFSFSVSMLSNGIMKAVGAIVIILFVGFALYFVNKKNVKTLHIENPVAMFFIGIALGTVNSFLGIGGGPINITVFLLMFSLAVKDGAIYSIFVVLFCQLSNLTTVFISNQFRPYHDYLPLALCAIIAGVAGGIIGSTLNRRFSPKAVRVIFSLVMVFIFTINVYNAISGIFFN